MPPTPSARSVATDETVSRDRSPATTNDPAPVSTRPLTVLITVPTLEAGSADEGAVDLARVLGKAGHHPVVVSQGGPLEPELAATGAALVRLDTTSRNPIVIGRNAAALRRLVRERGCDVVHALARASAWSAWIAARSCGVPFFTTCYAGYREQNILKHWYNGVIARGDRVIAASDQIAEWLADHHGLPCERLSVIGPSIDLAPFEPAHMTAERIARMRNAWGVGGSTRVILVPGRIIRREGHHLVVAAAAQLKAKGLKDFLIVFAGEDEGRSRYSGELWDLVLATNTADVIRIAGQGTDRAAAYAAATTVVSAAIQLAALQRALIEAMAMARPVVASDLAAGPDVLPAPPTVPEGHVAGLRFQAGDAAALAAAIIRMISLSEAQRQAMGRRARTLVLAEFDRATIAARTLAVYAGVVAGRASSNSTLLRVPKAAAGAERR